MRFQSLAICRQQINQARTTSGFFIGGNMGAGRVDVELESGSELRVLYV